MGSGIAARGVAALLALGLVSAAVPPAGAGERVLRTEVDLAAPPAEVWKAWTTAEGIGDYFDQAWGVVLTRLERRFTSGPVDWNAASPLAAARRSLKVTLAEGGFPARP